MYFLVPLGEKKRKSKVACFDAHFGDYIILWVLWNIMEIGVQKYLWNNTDRNIPRSPCRYFPTSSIRCLVTNIVAYFTFHCTANRLRIMPICFWQRCNFPRPCPKNATRDEMLCRKQRILCVSHCFLSLACTRQSVGWITEQTHRKEEGSCKLRNVFSNEWTIIPSHMCHYGRTMPYRGPNACYCIWCAVHTHAIKGRPATITMSLHSSATAVTLPNGHLPSPTDVRVERSAMSPVPSWPHKFMTMTYGLPPMCGQGNCHAICAMVCICIKTFFFNGEKNIPGFRSQSFDHNRHRWPILFQAGES